MDRIAANRATVEGQSRLNLRPLPNRLGHNGPYFGTGLATETDAERIAGHSTLFTNVENFEADLKAAILSIWDECTELHVARAAVEAGDEEAAFALNLASDTVEMAFQFLQEAYLVAEVLDDRTLSRIRKQETRDFLALIATTPREAMRPLDCLAEEARLTWQIARLMDRLETVAMNVKETGRSKWTPEYFQELERLTARTEALASPPTAATLQAMNDNDLAEELRGLEERARDTRQTIALIHAIRTVRHA